MINKNSHIPIYIQLEDILIDLIESEELKEGDLIPSENELAKKYGISRMTAKKAIDLLTQKGYVVREIGKGTYVLGKETKIELPLNKLRGFTQNIEAMGLSGDTQVLTFEEIKPTKEIAEVLEISLDENVWKMERLRLINEVPVVLEESYIRVSILPELKKENLFRSKFRYIREQGYEIGVSEREISAEIPRDYVAKSLRIKGSEPILVAKCITHFKSDEVLEYSKIYYNQKKYKFKLKAESN